MKARLRTDGGARGNPGPAGIGVVLESEDGRVLAEVEKSIGIATNNVAEYTALIEGLQLALDHGVTDLEVFLDSLLVVSQMNGEWKIKDQKIRPLALRASGLTRRFRSVALAHVRRELNVRADALANAAMDTAEAKEAVEPPGQVSLLGDDV